MEPRTPPETEEGWFALHDLRTVDWDAWRAADDERRKRALASGVEFLERHENVEDSVTGASATYSVLGHGADLMQVHLRPELAHLDTIQRQFERTELAAFTERTDSYVSVTEVSGYISRAFFDDEGEVEDAGTERYLRTRLYPQIPDAEHVSFYPMDKRRDPDYNWYDLPFEERAELMEGHGAIGRDHAGAVKQMITGSVGLDDWEWGVTLWADDAVAIKRLLYEMRFDPSSSRYAEFGRFYVGRRVAPTDLDALLAGEPVGEDYRTADGAADADRAPPAGPPGEGAGSARDDGAAPPPGGDGAAPSGEGVGPARGDGATAGGPPTNGASPAGGADSVREALSDLDVYAGQPHGEDVYAMVLYSEADPDDLADEVAGLRSNFDHYDTHVKTAVYEGNCEESAVVSIWETERAAGTAAGFLEDLPGVVRRAGDVEGTFGTMGMFYTVEPESREAFVEKFETVGGLLADMDGHLETDLLANRDDENDMFIASRWESKDDAMAFFRSDAFADTVDWGRDVLADRPRHVFLA